MPRTTLARRHDAVPDVARQIRAEMVAALGWTEIQAEVLREVGTAVRAIVTDPQANASDRLRAAGMIVDWIGPRSSVTVEADGARGPLVALTIGAPSTPVRVEQNASSDLIP